MIREIAQPQRLPLSAADNRARLTFYPPGLRQCAHRHHQAHISIIVAGSVRDISADRDEVAFASSLTLRPYEITHRAAYGPQGALILSVDVEGRATPAIVNGWIHRNLSGAERSLLRWVLTEGGAQEEVSECIEDLLAGIEMITPRGKPPAWLMRARECLTDHPAGARIDALALAAGVHRAHFARAFLHWFKLSPSLFRRRAMLSRAIATVASGGSLALAAHTAGFADQSHLCRAMRAAIGTTPHRLLRRR